MPGAGEVPGTGASGGGGSVALLDAMGYEAAAMTGRPEMPITCASWPGAETAPPEAHIRGW